MGELIAFPSKVRRTEPWMRQAEAAEYMGVSVRTLRRWHGRGLPVHGVGGTPLYRPSELDEWVERLRKSQG